MGHLDRNRQFPTLSASKHFSRTRYRSTPIFKEGTIPQLISIESIPYEDCAPEDSEYDIHHIVPLSQKDLVSNINLDSRLLKILSSNPNHFLNLVILPKSLHVRLNNLTGGDALHGGPIYIKALLTFSLYTFFMFIKSQQYQAVMRFYSQDNVDPKNESYIQLYSEILYAKSIIDQIGLSGIRGIFPKAFEQIQTFMKNSRAREM